MKIGFRYHIYLLFIGGILFSHLVLVACGGDDGRAKVVDDFDPCWHLDLSSENMIIDFAIDDRYSNLYDKCFEVIKLERYKFDLFLNVEIVVVRINHKNVFKKETLEDENGVVLLKKVCLNGNGKDTLIVFEELIDNCQEIIEPLVLSDDYRISDYYINASKERVKLFGGVGGNILSMTVDSAFSLNNAKAAFELITSNNKNNRFIGFMLVKYLLDQDEELPEDLMSIYNLYRLENPSIIINMACMNRKIKYSDYSKMGFDSILYNYYEGNKNNMDLRFVR